MSTLLNTGQTTPESPRPGSSQDTLMQVLDGMRDLRDGLESYQSLEHLLVEQAKATEFNHRMVSDRLAELHQQIEQLSEDLQNSKAAALISAKSANLFAAEDHRFADNPTPQISLAMIGVVVVGLLLTVWSIRAYLKTGNPYIGALGLVVVNLAGAIAILMRRRGRS